MANKENQIKIGIGYSVDKAGLEEIQSLFQQIANKAKVPGENLSSGLQKASQTAQTLDGILEKTFNVNLGTLNVTKFNQELQKSGLTMKSIQADLKGVGESGVMAYNRLAQAILGTNMQLKQSSKMLDQMFITFKNTVRYGISSSIFNNFTNSIQKAYSYVRDLDESLNNIRIVTEKSADEMDRFAVKANTAAKTLSANTLDYTNAALIYYQQGLSDQEAQARAETTVKVANVTAQTGEAVSEQLTAVWNGYKVSAEQTEEYVDKLAAVAATTAADLQELSIGMSKVASAANAMGVDFDDLNAQIATIVSVTRQAPESVGTALKTIYARLGDLKVDGVDEFGIKLGEVTSQMKTMGIEILDQNGNMRSMTQVMAEVAEKWENWTQAQRQAAAVAMAGKRQYNNLIALFNNWDMYSNALETSANALGTLQKQQDIYMESTNAKLKRLKASWQDLYKSIGNTKTINTFIDFGRNFVQTFDNFSDSFGGGLKTVATSLVIISNIFNKQILNSISNILLRSSAIKQNLEAMAAMRETLNAQVLASENSNNPYLAGSVANSQAQYEISKKIFEVRTGLSQEEQNIAIEYQRQIGSLAEQVALKNKQMENITRSIGLEQEYSNITKMEYSDIDKIVDDLVEKQELQNKNVEDITKEYKTVNGIFNTYTKLSKEEKESVNLRKEIETTLEKTSIATKNEVNALLNKYKTDAQILVNKEAILSIIEKELQQEKQKPKIIQEQIDGLTRILDLKSETVELDARMAGIGQQLDQILNHAKMIGNIGGIFTAITSSLSSFVMGVGSISSIMKTLKDETSSFGDKVEQVFMSGSMALMMFGGAYKKLSDSLGVSTSIWEALAVKKVKNKILDEEIAKTQELLGIKLSKREAELVVLKGKDAQSSYALATANDKLSKSFLGINASAKSLLVTLGALAIVAASVYATKVIYDKFQEAKLEAAQATLDENKVKQEEIEINEELYKSYKKAYDQYKQGTISKEELGKTTEELCKKYRVEGLEIAKLTGQYDELNKKINNVRQDELQQSLTGNINAESGAAEKMKQAARKGRGYVARSSSVYAQAGIMTALARANPLIGIAELFGAKGHEDIDAYKVDFGGNFGSFTAKNVDDAHEMLALYDEIKQKVDDFKDGTDEGYKEAVKWLEKMQETAEETRAIFESEKYAMAELQFTSFDIDNVKSVEEYDEKVARLRNTLKVVYQDEEEVEKVLKAHFADTANQFIETGRQLEVVRKYLFKLTDESWNKLRESLNPDEIKTLLSGKVNLDDLINYDDPEQVAEIIKSINRQVEQQDLDIVVSLRAKITSDKKLTKKELEEALGEENKLLSDEKYGAEFADFDNKSALEQLELLNQVLVDRINLNKEWERTQTETYTKLIENEKEYQGTLEKRKKELENELSNARDAGQRKAIEEELARVNNELDISNEKIKDFNYQMSQYFFNEVAFDGLIDGIDGVILEVKTLKDLTSAVGEGWTIAADKLEVFAKNFPELMADQENYNYLQDGSLQLTEEGQEAFKKQLEARKEEIILQNEVYKKELQMTADKKLAEYEYYKSIAEHYEQYAEGAITESQLEQKLKKSVTEYAVRMAEITGTSDKELNQIIQENNNKTADNTITNVEDMYNAYQQLGSAIYACTQGVPVPDWSNNRASAPPVDVSSHNIEVEVDYKISDKLGKEEAEAMARMARQAADTAYNEYSTAVSKMVAADGQTNALLAGWDTMGQRKKGKDKKQEKFDDEFDRYYDIKNAIGLVEKALNKVDKIQSKVHGKELIQSLKNENKLIKQQAQNYETLYAQQQIELEEVQGTLMSMGGEFDNQGYLTNYASLTASALEQYQAKIAEYNAGKINEETKKAYEESYNQLKKYIDRYNNLFYSEMQDTKEKLEDSIRKVMENNLQIWETELKVKLDFEEARRTWMDFLKDISYDFRLVYKDLIAEASHFALKMETYSGLGTIETDLNAIKDIVLEIDKINSGHGSDMFESISDAQEKLKELDSQLEEDAKNMKQLWEDAWETYLDGIDQTKDKLDDLDEQFERINEELDFQSKLIELLYGDEAYKMLDALYKGQEKYAENQITSIKAQADLWHQLWVESGATLENQSTWTEDQKRYYEQWGEAQSALNESITNYIELLKTDYLNAVNDVLKSLEAALTGSSLKDIETQWGRITKDTDKYYDSIEQAYEAQKFANKIDQEIAKTTNIKNQQKLMALRDREVNYLREKANLTKYDLDAAEARYQIAVKEMALEDARQNKTSMKLVRNEQGNWSYQYMADMDDVEAKQDDILQSYGDLYKLAGDAYQDNLSALQSLQSEYLESAREIYENMYLSEQEKEIKLEELRTYYYDQYSKLAEENQLYRNDLATAGAGLLLQIYQQDEEAYQYMTNSEQSMLDILINSSIENYQDLQDKATENYNNIGAASTKLMEEVRSDWSASAQFIAEAWNADNGVSVKAQIVSANERITQATEYYQEKVDECAQEVERDFGEEGIKGQIDKASEATDELTRRTKIMVDNSKIFLNGLKTVIGEVGEAWLGVQGKVAGAIKQISEYLSIIGQVEEVSARMYQITGGTVDFSEIVAQLGGDPSGGKKFDKTRFYNGYGVFDANSDAPLSLGYEKNGVQHFYTQEEANKYASELSVKAGGKSLVIKDLYKLSEEELKKLGFATGGYTGSWGDDNGRLAFLHQKELVLNQEDTSNFLKGVSLLRDMAALNGSIERSIAASIGAMALQFSGNGIGNIGTPSAVANNIGGDTYYVTAEFPNATDVDEIRQAILNLPNIVSQHTNKNLY